METLDHKCPSCTAPLPFNPTIQKWKCEYCGNEYTLDELEKYEKNEKLKESDKKISASNEPNEYNETMDVDLYVCSNCGAEIITDENTTATFCVYCGNTAVMKNRLNGVLKPQSIIPFKNTKNQAEAAFIKFRKGKPFAPKDFSDLKNIEKITGVYIPFWVYDCDTKGTLAGIGKNQKTWRSGDYVYTKTYRYNVVREGRISYEKVPADGSKKFDDDIMDSIEPFEYKDLVDFNASFLAGFLSEKYDVTQAEAFERAKMRIATSTTEKLRETIKGYSGFDVSKSNVNISLKDTNYVLLPVWMLNINYKGKIRKFAMNGQTGKMIGDVPIEPLKVVSWSIFIFIATFIVVLIINIIAIGGIG